MTQWHRAESSVATIPQLLESEEPHLHPTSFQGDSNLLLCTFVELGRIRSPKPSKLASMIVSGSPYRSPPTMVGMICMPSWEQLDPLCFGFNGLRNSHSFANWLSPNQCATIKSFAVSTSGLGSIEFRIASMDASTFVRRAAAVFGTVQDRSDNCQCSRLGTRALVHPASSTRMPGCIEIGHPGHDP